LSFEGINRFARICRSRLILALLLGSSLCSFAEPSAQPEVQPAPRGNPYDLLGRVFQPFTNVLLSGGTRPEKAMQVALRISAVEGRLPRQFVGATLKAWVENPDKLRLDAPVFGEDFTVVRNGNEVWATPGDKIEFLLRHFKFKPPPSPKSNTPLSVPISAQQAVFLVALFDIYNREVAEVETLGNEEFRIIKAGLQNELAVAARADDFRASIWIDHANRPRRMEIQRRDFSTVVDFLQLRFTPTLPPETWQAPETDNIYRTTAEHLETVLYVVVNSLHTDSEDEPWKNER
jgi:hypothetical protein